MTIDETLAYYATRAKVAAFNGDEIAEAHWVERINRVSDQREVARLAEELATHAESMREWAEASLHCATFDELKGSPDHSVVRHG